MALFKFTKSIIDGTPIDVYNYGNHTRDFTFIDDIVEGVIKTIDSPAVNNLNWDSNSPDPATSKAPWCIYNIGNNKPVKLMDYISALEKALGKKAIVNLLPLQPGDVADTYANIDRLEGKFNYKPKTSVLDGVSKFVQWYKIIIDAKSFHKLKVAVGLGYVGLPLALAFGKKRPVIAYDKKFSRIQDLKNGIDTNLEISRRELNSTKRLHFTNNEKEIKSSNCYIVTVPTPIDKFKRPDLKPLLNASKLVAKFIKKGDIVIYESTVYPGCIEEKCVPVLEKISGLVYNKNFFCGYSPERINPGDSKHTVVNIKKITSGSTRKASDLIDKLYSEIVTVGTHKASSIKVAEAAKVIENTQRDLNIALINELSIIFSRMNINTNEVLDAAASKWNFYHLNLA